MDLRANRTPAEASVKQPEKFALDYHRKRRYTIEEFDAIIVGHQQTHPDLDPSECAGCTELYERRREIENTLGRR